MLVAKPPKDFVTVYIPPASVLDTASLTLNTTKVDAIVLEHSTKYKQSNF